jgi:hypothetical protein
MTTIPLVVACAHWSPAARAGGGRCALGYAGGWPNLSHCAACLEHGGDRRSPAELAAERRMLWEETQRMRGGAPCGGCGD